MNDRLKELCIRNFVNKNETLNRNNIVMVAVNEAAEFFGHLVASDFGILGLEKFVVHMDALLDENAYEKIYDAAQMFYKMCCPGKELKGLRMALKRREVAEVYYPLFYNFLDMSSFTVAELCHLYGDRTKDNKSMSE